MNNTSEPNEKKKTPPKKQKPSGFQKVFKNLNLDEIENFADLGAGSPNFATQIYNRFGCNIIIYPVNADGQRDPSVDIRLEKYLARLKARGVDMERVKVAKPNEPITQVDLVSTLGSFGEIYKIQNAKKWLNSLMGTQTRWVTDIKKGSGGYAMAHKIGNAQTISKFNHKDKFYARCIVTKEGVDNLPIDKQWEQKAKEIVGKDGFYIQEDVHSFTFVKRSDVLVVTFDNLDVAGNRSDRLPWGFSFIEKMGYSMLGVMSTGWTWYRDDWVIAQFNRLRDEGFFDQFKKVIFYGASMGGYAAIAFSSAAKNAQVVVFSPQSTLDKTLVPWETRYKKAWMRDFSGDYGDAAQSAHSAKDVYIFYDPYQPLDSGHAARIQGDNVHHFHTPLMGHKVGTNFLRMGVLQPIVLDAINGNLTHATFRKLLKKRKTVRRYMMELLNRAKDNKHPLLALVVAQYYVKNVNEDQYFIRQAAELEQKLQKTKNAATETQ